MQPTDRSPADDSTAAPAAHTPAVPLRGGPRPGARNPDPRAHMRGDGLYGDAPHDERGSAARERERSGTRTENTG